MEKNLLNTPPETEVNVMDSEFAEIVQQELVVYQLQHLILKETDNTFCPSNYYPITGRAIISNSHLNFCILPIFFNIC